MMNNGLDYDTVIHGLMHFGTFIRSYLFCCAKEGFFVDNYLFSTFSLSEIL